MNSKVKSMHYGFSFFKDIVTNITWTMKQCEILLQNVVKKTEALEMIKKICQVLLEQVALIESLVDQSPIRPIQPSQPAI